MLMQEQQTSMVREQINHQFVFSLFEDNGAAGLLEKTHVSMERTYKL